MLQLPITLVGNSLNEWTIKTYKYLNAHKRL